MHIKIDNEFREICKQIITENKTDAEWSEIESCDMFQSKHYGGGYEALEQAFCFSYYDEKDKEYWFQLTLKEIQLVADLKKTSINIREV